MDISRAIFAYNHAQWYVDEVLALASVFGGDVDVVFTLDKLAIRLEEAQAAVAETSKALREAEATAAELQSRVTELDGRATGTDLFSDRLDVEKEAFEVDQENAAAAAEVERLRAELTTAESVLDQARTGAHAASFNPAAAGILEARAARTATSSRSAAVPVSSASVIPITTIPPLTSRPRRARRSSRSPTRSCSTRSTTAAAESGSSSRRPTGFTGSTATSRNATPPFGGSGAVRRPVGRPRRLDRRRHRPAPPSGPEARDDLPAGHDVVPGIRRNGVRLAGRTDPVGPDPFRGSPVFEVVPSVDVDDDVVEFTTAPSRG